MLATSLRGCHEDATRKLLPWNSSLTALDAARCWREIYRPNNGGPRFYRSTPTCNDALHISGSSAPDPHRTGWRGAVRHRTVLRHAVPDSVRNNLQGTRNDVMMIYGHYTI